MEPFSLSYINEALSPLAHRGKAQNVPLTLISKPSEVTLLRSCYREGVALGIIRSFLLYSTAATCAQITGRALQN